MRQDEPSGENAKVLSLEQYRAARERGSKPTEGRKRPPANDKNRIEEKSVFYRGNLYARVANDGEVDFNIVEAELKDAPALVLACLVMCMRLTRLIDAEWHMTP